MANPVDDRFHTPNADPFWNESSSFSFMMADEGVCGSVYFYHRPNMSLSAGGPFLWDASGTHDYDCLYWDWNSCQPLPVDADMHDFELRNGLRSTMVEPLHSFEFVYDRNGCTLDLRWDAIMDPVDMRSRSKDADNEGIKSWLSSEGTEDVSTGHFQQCGRMVGTVTVGSRTIGIDCFSFRDRTWGPRVLDNPPRASWVWGVASPTSSFLAVSAVTDGDHIEANVAEPVVHGWYMHDGVSSPLVTGTRRVRERHVDGRPLRQVIEATDALGRTLEVEGVADHLLRFTGYSGILNWWGLCQWTWNGETAWGDLHEVATFANAARIRASAADS